MKKLSTVFLLLVCILVYQSASSQNFISKSFNYLLNTDRPVVFLPVIYSSPETGPGAGGAAMYYYRIKGDTSSKPSSIQSYFIYTFNKQLLFKNPFEMFFNQNKIWINGEMSYYIYPYKYFGEGNNISTLTYDSYSANYFKSKLNFLRKLKSKIYAGVSMYYDNYFKISLDSDPVNFLQKPLVNGLDGGPLMGFGATIIFDNRNNLYAPNKGSYLSIKATQYENDLIGIYAFSDFTVDYRKYFPVWETAELGAQFYHQSVTGNAPFFNLAQLGDTDLLRGYYGGAYRDNNQTLIQAELRQYVLDRLLISTFGGLGNIANNPFDNRKLLGSYGVGLRYEINKKEHVRIRIDYARGYNQDGIYIDINEAF